MIIEAILAVVKFIVMGLISMLPKIPEIKIGYLDGVFQALSMTDLVVDVKVLSGCFGILFLFMNAQLIWGVIMWVVRKIPSIK